MMAMGACNGGADDFCVLAGIIQGVGANHENLYLDSPPYTPILHPQNHISPLRRVKYCRVPILTLVNAFFGVALL